MLGKDSSDKLVEDDMGRKYNLYLPRLHCHIWCRIGQLGKILFSFERAPLCSLCHACNNNHKIVNFMIFGTYGFLHVQLHAWMVGVLPTGDLYASET
jgi:hypothetical protein